MKLGLIGAGNMASALARGIGEPVVVSDVVADKAQWCTVHQSMAPPYYSVTGGFPGCVASHTDPNNNQKVVDFTAYYAPRYGYNYGYRPRAYGGYRVHHRHW